MARNTPARIKNPPKIKWVVMRSPKIGIAIAAVKKGAIYCEIEALKAFVRFTPNWIRNQKIADEKIARVIRITIAFNVISANTNGLTESSMGETRISKMLAITKLANVVVIDEYIFVVFESRIKNSECEIIATRMMMLPSGVPNEKSSWFDID